MLVKEVKISNIFCNCQIVERATHVSLFFEVFDHSITNDLALSLGQFANHALMSQACQIQITHNETPSALTGCIWFGLATETQRSKHYELFRH